MIFFSQFLDTRTLLQQPSHIDCRTHIGQRKTDNTNPSTYRSLSITYPTHPPTTPPSKRPSKLQFSSTILRQSRNPHPARTWFSTTTQYNNPRIK